MKPVWREGNQIELLENGEEFFPRVFAALDRASTRIYIETFILADDEVGLQLRDVLVAAAARGVEVDVLADGFGSEPLGQEYCASLAAAGVRLHMYEPRARLFGVRVNLFRRLHRKLVLIDGSLAYIGGINFCQDQMLSAGPRALHDYAVELSGPVVDDLRAFAIRSHSAVHPAPARGEREPAAAEGAARVRFVTRDNHRHRTDIEREYRAAIRRAHSEILIANAYFFPGYRLLRDLRDAARRGVKVSLIVQGNPDMAIVTVVARWLYDYLIPAGVRIYEFCERPMHAKVAVVDGHWATVGSSNLDPLSLSLNLEANVLIEDRSFGTLLRERLQRLIESSCQPVTPAQVPRRTVPRMLAGLLVFHFLRHFPAWARRLRSRRPTIVETSVEPDGHAGR